MGLFSRRIEGGVEAEAIFGDHFKSNIDAAIWSKRMRGGKAVDLWLSLFTNRTKAR